MAEMSKMIPLGTIAPSFHLLDTVSGKWLKLDELASDKATVIMFICNHCPYVKHIQSKLVDIVKAYQTKGISFVAISSNDSATYPQDGPVKMSEEAHVNGYTFPYLFDEDQSVAKAYQAACTPEFYVFNSDLKCVYRGRFDDSTPKNGIECTGNDLIKALENILNEQDIGDEQMPAIGCGIKWRAEN